MKILVVEDDKLTADALVAILSHHHYAVEVAKDGQMGWELVDSYAYDLLLLDVRLPKLDGIHLCQRIRSHQYQMPILLLTGQNSSHEKAIGLDAGADDYMVKPCDPEELVARIRALLRRSSSSSLPILSWGDLRFDPSSYEASYQEQSLALTAKELALLELFLRHPKRVFSCSAILEHLWAYGETPGEEAVRTHIKGLRQKLKAVDCPADMIETVYGIGYRLKPLDALPATASATNSSTQPQPPPSLAEPEVARQQTLLLLQTIWSRHKGRVMEQVALLFQVITDLRHQSFSIELQQQARQEAHTLIGALGTFGFPMGSQLAQEIEQMLVAHEKERWQPNEVEHFSHLILSLQQEVNRPLQQEVNRPLQQEVNRSSTPSPVCPTRTAHPPTLLIIDQDSTLSRQLLATAHDRGFHGEIATSLHHAKACLTAAPPDIVILDPTVSSNLKDTLVFLLDLSQRSTLVPVIILTDHANLTERLELTRLGGRIFLSKSTPVSDMLEIVTQTLQTDRLTATVMVVDDDPAILAASQALLSPYGLEVKTLAEPQAFWNTLEAIDPDLLILDIEMPEVNGIELCQVVRKDSRWGSLPILFLTAHTDLESVNQVFAAGADDFISKPIQDQELITRTISRLERMQSLKWHYAHPKQAQLQ